MSILGVGIHKFFKGVHPLMRFSKQSIVLTCCLTACLAGVLHAEDTRPMDQPFDEYRVAWKDDRVRLIAGLSAAEKFRRGLLKPKVGSRAALIGMALERFRKKYPVPLPARPTLKHFTVTTGSFLKQIRGRENLDANNCFADFAGRWYGTWDQLRVNHHWHRVLTDQSRLRPLGKNGLVPLMGLQYAWIGDGFGWNYLVRPQRRSGAVVLGFVYHLKPHRPNVIRDQIPLVGYLDGPGRLIWITPNEVFFEEVLPHKSAESTRYSITGFAFKIKKDNKLVSQGDGFQAIYTRHADHRPRWLQFPVTLAVE